jgi:nucleotide sugar dehydrogenase
LRAIAGETTHPFSVVSNPEFLKQGSAVDDFLKPDRVVVGTMGDDSAGALMRTLYAPFTRTGSPILIMDCASAELSKYAANGMLATRVSFMNEMANVCEQVGANVDAVRQVVASDSRIGASFLFPGIGYGGSCFPKDVKALVRFAKDSRYRFRILEAVEAVNTTQKRRLFDKMRNRYRESLAKRTSALTSFGKQLPPYPIPGNRNDAPMRESDATTCLTASTFAPTCSQTFAISFMKDTRVASMPLAAYLLSSALAQSMIRIGDPVRVNGA